MPNSCRAEIAEEVKRLLSGLDPSLSSTARLVAVLGHLGITDRCAVESLLSVSDRTVRRAVADLDGRRSEKSGQECPKRTEMSGQKWPERSKVTEERPEMATGTDVAIAPARYESRANNESPTEIVISRFTPPTPSVELEARDGEVCVGHGVLVSGDTIRHRDFAISLQGVYMGTLATGKSQEAIRSECAMHALQWAAELEAGKSPRDVLPSKIANFLSRSIMATANRAACQPSPGRPPARDKTAEARAMIERRIAARRTEPMEAVHG